MLLIFDINSLLKKFYQSMCEKFVQNFIKKIVRFRLKIIIFLTKLQVQEFVFKRFIVL